MLKTEMLQNNGAASERILILTCLFFAAAFFMPLLAHASLESSLDGIRSKLTGTILPVVSVIGIAFAGVSFFTGNPQAKQHIFYAVIGAMIGLGAQSIVDFISQTVR